MPRFPALQAVLARLDGRSEFAVETVARSLREAGMLPPSVKGWGAAQASHQNAATMLIAILAADGPSASPEAVQRYTGLRSLPVPDRDRLPDPLPGILSLPFEQAIAALVSGWPAVETAMPSSRWQLRVSRPWPVAELRLRDGAEWRLVANWIRSPDVAQVALDELPAGYAVDKVVTSTVTERTFSSLSALFYTADTGE